MFGAILRLGKEIRLGEGTPLRLGKGIMPEVREGDPTKVRLRNIYFLIQDILYFKGYLMSCYLSYYPHTCPLLGVPCRLDLF